MVFSLFRRRPAAATAPAPAPSSEAEHGPVPRASDGAEALPNSVVAQAVGPLLWQDVAYGMTPDQVRATRPEAIPSVDARTLADGASSLLRIPSLELAGHDYSVHFYFRNGSLTQVTIATNDHPSADKFHSIANALRLRYGREVEFNDYLDSFSTAEWLSEDGINVSLVFHEAIGCLNVNFQYRYADAALKL